MDPIEKFRNYIKYKNVKFDLVLLPLVRKRFEPINLKKFVSVQPMTKPLGNDENSETK
jgi:hypothetical protein